MRMPSPELAPTWLSWTSVPRVPLTRVMPRALPATSLRRSVLPVDAVVGVDQGDAGFLVLVDDERLDDVAGGARFEVHADVEAGDRAVGDRHVVEAAVADADAEADAVDRVAAEVDGDARRADHQPDLRAVDHVGGQLHALGDELAAVHVGGDRRRGDAPREAGRRRVGVAGRVDGAHLERVVGDVEGEHRARARAALPRRAVEPALERRAGLAGGEAERPARQHGDLVGVGVDGRVRCRRVRVGDVVGPRVAGRRRVGVAGEVDRAHDERVRAGGQAGERARARARLPGGSADGIECALVAQVGAGRAVVAATEADRHRAAGRRVGRAPRGSWCSAGARRALVDRRRHDRPLVGLGGEVLVLPVVGGAHLEAVRAGLEELREVVRAGALHPALGLGDRRGPAARPARAARAARSARSGRAAGRRGTRRPSPTAAWCRRWR